MVDPSERKRRLWAPGLALLAIALAPGLAFAGTLYINGVRADGLAETEFKNVNVRVDSRGDVYIDAPRYSIEVVQPGGVAPPTQPVAAQPVTGQPATSYAPAPSYTAQPAPTYAAQPAVTAASPAAPTSSAAVAPGSWWLVTDDNASKGHVIDVYIGGVLVQTVRSGDPQVMLDVSAYLHSGENMVQFSARGGETPSGGVLHVYIGSGVITQGTLSLNAPQIDFSRRSTDGAAGASRQFQLRVP